MASINQRAKALPLDCGIQQTSCIHGGTRRYQDQGQLAWPIQGEVPISSSGILPGDFCPAAGGELGHWVSLPEHKRGLGGLPCLILSK